MSTARKVPAKAQTKKKFRVFGVDEATGKKVTILLEGDPQIGDVVKGTDIDSGAKVQFSVQGRNRAI